MNNISEIGYYDGGIFISVWSKVLDISARNTGKIRMLFHSSGQDLFVRLFGEGKIRELPITPGHAEDLVELIEA